MIRCNFVQGTLMVLFCLILDLRCWTYVQIQTFHFHFVQKLLSPTCLYLILRKVLDSRFLRKRSCHRIQNCFHKKLCELVCSVGTELIYAEWKCTLLGCFCSFLVNRTSHQCFWSIKGFIRTYKKSMGLGCFVSII